MIRFENCDFLSCKEPAESRGREQERSIDEARILELVAGDSIAVTGDQEGAYYRGADYDFRFCVFLLEVLVHVIVFCGEMGIWWNGLLYGLGGLACTGVVLLLAFQEKLVYVPIIPGMSKGYPITPARLRLRYEDVWLESTDGVRLHSWFIKASPDCEGPTVLFFQENAGNIAYRLEFVELMLRRLNCNVFMLSYRGYGASDGYPSQPGLTLDAEAALEHLLQRTDIDSKRIFVFGRSLGGAVGSALTKQNPGKVSGLILENTFTSVLDMAGVMLPPLRFFVGGPSSGKCPKLLNWFVKSPWRTIDLVTDISEPVLFLSGLKDEMVPPSHMKRLYIAARKNTGYRYFVEFPHGMHMDTWMRGGEHYWKSIENFIKQHTAGETRHQDSSTEVDGHFKSL